MRPAGGATQKSQQERVQAKGVPGAGEALVRN